jgi:hypothetical protein
MWDRSSGIVPDDRPDRLRLSSPGLRLDTLTANQPWCGMRGVRFFAIVLSLWACLPAMLRAEPAPVECAIAPDGESASVMLTNPRNDRASCQANCKFATGIYNDNPQIICTKPVPGKKQVEMCILRATGNKFQSVVAAMADCRKP